MTDGTWAEGVDQFQAVQQGRWYVRGGVIHGPGEGVPIRIDPAHEYLMTAEQAKERLGWCKPPSDLVTPGERGAIHYEWKSLDFCHNCERTIRVMVNRGTGYCSENCRKALAQEWDDDG